MFEGLGNFPGGFATGRPFRNAHARHHGILKRDTIAQLAAKQGALFVIAVAPKIDTFGLAGSHARQQKSVGLSEHMRETCRRLCPLDVGKRRLGRDDDEVGELENAGEGTRLSGGCINNREIGLQVPGLIENVSHPLDPCGYHRNRRQGIH